MTRVLFGRGAKGALIEDLQRGLIERGIPLARVDGDFGPRTQEAVRAFQATQGAPQTGIVDADAWTALTGKPMPSLAERCLQVTAAFEGHDYTIAAGNWDGAWLTWGIIGFTMKSSRVQEIVRAVDAAMPAVVDDAFGAHAPTLRRIVRAKKAEQKAWAISVSSPDGRRLVTDWQDAFARFGEMPDVRAAQRKNAFDNYFTPAVATAAALGLVTEFGTALCFDIHVQNGGVSQKVRGRLPPLVNGQPERVRREALAQAVADSCLKEFRENVRSRKMALARGTGIANGITVNLPDWGLADERA